VCCTARWRLARRLQALQPRVQREARRTEGAVAVGRHLLAVPNVLLDVVVDAIAEQMEHFMARTIHRCQGMSLVLAHGQRVAILIEDSSRHDSRSPPQDGPTLKPAMGPSRGRAAEVGRRRHLSDCCRHYKLGTAAPLAE
jgi:hypothetical protein